MISIDTESNIHQMLMAGTPRNKIAEELGVSETTIGRIKRAIKMADDVPARTRERARALAISGISPKGISVALKIPVEVVQSIKRADFIRSRYTETVPTDCPTCGGAMVPEEGEDHELSETPDSIKIEHARVLFEIADELVGLAKSYAVKNMLFYSLSDRAEAAITTITTGVETCRIASRHES
jgi:DNA-binding CsgD family transcriptional regulator